MSTPSSNLTLNLYFADLQDWSAFGDEALLRRLPPIEQARAARFHQPIDRQRFLLARVLLRQQLSAHLQVPPHALPIEIDKHGKPALAAAVATDKLHFSISHSGQRIALALASAPVGIDIEAETNDATQLQAIQSLALSDIERLQLSAIAAPHRPLSLLKLWTSKEALLKALGSGLRTAPDQFTLADTMHLDQSELEHAPWYARATSDGLPALQWQCGALGTHYLVAVAALGEATPSVQTHWLHPADLG